MRFTLIKTFLVVTITSAVALGADNTIGTWKLDLEKSKYTGAPMPVKSLVLAREAVDGGVRQATTGEQTDGTPIKAVFTAKYDGNDVRISGNSPYDIIAIKQVNANTLTDTRKKSDGKYQATSRYVVSNGGKTMTLTIKGTNNEGKEFTAIFVYDKQ